MKKQACYRALLAIALIAVAGMVLLILINRDANSKQEQKSLSLNEYLEETNESWFLTGKKEYTIQAMMVSKETTFHNDLEVVDLIAADDGKTVVLKGTRDEVWTSPLPQVISRYKKPDGSELRKEDFANKYIY